MVCFDIRIQIPDQHSSRKMDPLFQCKNCFTGWAVECKTTHGNVLNSSSNASSSTTIARIYYDDD
jgi:hypothetical protein